MVLLDAPNSPAHLEKQGVELGTFLSLLQRPSSPTLLGRMVPEDMPETIRILYQLSISNISSFPLVTKRFSQFEKLY